jgi:uncharacterized small protein (DUF1192 family)
VESAPIRLARAQPDVSKHAVEPTAFAVAQMMHSFPPMAMPPAPHTPKSTKKTLRLRAVNKTSSARKAQYRLASGKPMSITLRRTFGDTEEASYQAGLALGMWSSRTSMLSFAADQCVKQHAPARLIAKGVDAPELPAAQDATLVAYAWLKQRALWLDAQIALLRAHRTKEAARLRAHRAKKTAERNAAKAQQQGVSHDRAGNF